MPSRPIHGLRKQLTKPQVGRACAHRGSGSVASLRNADDSPWTEHTPENVVAPRRPVLDHHKTGTKPGIHHIECPVVEVELFPGIHDEKFDSIGQAAGSGLGGGIVDHPHTYVHTST